MLVSRVVTAAFVPTENESDALPAPLLPPGNVIQLPSALAVHEHPAVVVIDTVPVPPLAPNDTLGEAMV
jgi:hypothetical protein